MRSILIHRYWHWIKVWSIFGVCVPFVFTFCLMVNLCQVSWWMTKELCGKWTDDDDWGATA